MSRCFPFPPPGYEERNNRPEDLDVLKEARRKEKKHKKEKDKERKKEKEKGKDESDEKQKDKKDRKKHKDKKEKHKDKKKDKEDRSKDKEKRSISDESTVSGVKLEDKHGDKLHPEGHISNRSDIVDAGKHSALFQGQNGTGPSKSSLPSKATDESKLVQAFSKHGDKLHPEGHRKDIRPAVDAGKHSSLLKGQNGTGPSQSVLPSKGTDGSKFVQELGRRIKDDGVSGSKLPDKPALVDERDKKMGAKAASGNTSAVVGKEKGNNKDKGVDVMSLDVQGPTNVPRGYAMVPQSIPPMDKGEVGRILRPLDDQNNGTPGVKEKLKETDEGKRGDKRKERDKKSHRKEKDKDKEKKRSKSKVKTERQGSEQAKLDAKGVSAGVAVVSNESRGALKEVKTSGVNEGNPRKRKDIYTNGFHETETSANKVQRHSPHQSMENGSQLKAFSTPTKSYDEHATPNSVTADYNGRLMNGMVEAQRPLPSIPNNSSAAMVRDQVAEVPKVPNQKSNPSKETATKVPNQKPIPSKEMPTKLPNQKPIPSKEMPTKSPSQKSIPSKEMPAKSPSQKSIPMKETQTLPNLEDVIAEVTKAPDQKAILSKEMPTKAPDQKAILTKEMPTKAPNQKSVPMKEMQTKVPNQKSVPNQKTIPLKETAKVPTLEDLIAEASRKPPHPDSKYLSGVLTVPSVADLGDDDQDWFFSKRGPSDKLKTEPVQVDKELQVWSKAVRIEQADICALPYVIPY